MTKGRLALTFIVVLTSFGCSAKKAETVPNVAGERLDVAISIVEDAGLDHESVGGGVFGIVVESNWKVCDQRPAAGSSTEGTDSVYLIVDRECDVVKGLEGGTMPDLVGERLDVAMIDMADAGIGYRTIGGGGVLGQDVARSWTVCKTKPAAGVSAKKARLFVERAC